MRAIGRLTIFADDAGNAMSADAAWVFAWLEQNNGAVEICEYSSGGYEHLWNVKGTEHILEQVPERLQCGSEWSGLMTPLNVATVGQAEAEVIVEQAIAKLQPPAPDDKWAVDSNRTKHFERGWVIYFTSAEYLRTKDPLLAVAGNAPYLVDWKTGECFDTGTAYPLEHYVAQLLRRSTDA